MGWWDRRERDSEPLAAVHIVEQETARFMADSHHRATAPIINRLEASRQQPNDDELRRLFNPIELRARKRPHSGNEKSVRPRCRGVEAPISRD